MRKTNILMAVAAFAAFAALPANAQASPDRGGLYIDVGANYTMGLNGFVVTGASGAALAQTADVAGFTAGVGFGLKGNEWRLGLQGDYFKQSNVLGSSSGVDGTVTAYTLAATYYPNAKTGFWTRVNLGYGQSKLSGGGNNPGTSSGFAGGFGIGYDWMLGGGQFAVAPYIAYLGQFSGGDFGGDFSGSKARISVMQIGVTLGYKH